MRLQQAVNKIFVQLAETIQQLSPPQYVQPCVYLVNHTVGQHVRHIIELFQCLENGYPECAVNYEKRKRDVAIETNRELALSLLQRIQSGLNKPDKEMVLYTSYNDISEGLITIHTNYFREVAYNLEHTIHHMALIRVGITEISNISLPEDFGVASSTVKHRNPCAQ